MYNNEWFSPPENYQDPNEEVVWKRPKYDPWMDESSPPVDMETYLRGRQPSDDPYAELRAPIERRGNFGFPTIPQAELPDDTIGALVKKFRDYGKGDDLSGMANPLGLLGPTAGGMVKLLNTEIPKSFPYRKTVDALDKLKQTIVIPEIPKSYADPLYAMTEQNSVGPMYRNIVKKDLFAPSSGNAQGAYIPYMGLQHGQGDAILLTPEMISEVLPHESTHRMYNRLTEGGANDLWKFPTPERYLGTDVEDFGKGKELLGQAYNWPNLLDENRSWKSLGYGPTKQENIVQNAFKSDRDSFIGNELMAHTNPRENISRLIQILSRVTTPEEAEMMANKIYSRTRENPVINAFHNFSMSRYPQVIENQLTGY